MRDGWEEATLGQLIRKRADFTPVDPDSEYVILGVQRSGWGFVQREPIRGDGQKFTKLMQIEADDLVYRTITAFEAPSGVAGPDEAGHFVTPQTFPVFKIDQRRLLPGYMRLLTTWPKFHEEMASRCTGTVLRRKTLSVGAFQSIPVALPPLAEQQRIVDLIESLDDAIAAAEVVSNALRTSASALASHMWMAGSPERLRDLGQLVTGATPSTKDASSWSSKDVPFVTPAEVPWGGQVFDSRASERFVSESAGASSTRRLDGTGVLQVCIGATVGKVGVTTGPALFNQQINAVFGLSVTDARVLAASMASPQFQTEIKRAAGSSTMPLISKGSWGEMEVRLPDEDSRTQWASMLEGADAAATAHAKSIADLRALRSNLLTALLSGEHEIPATYDELMVGEA